MISIVAVEFIAAWAPQIGRWMRTLGNIHLRERFGILSEPNVKPLAAATMLNAAGNNVYVIVLSWLAYEITDSPLAVGFVVGLRFVPIMVMGVISGAVSDRIHRPTVLRLYALWYTGLSFGFTCLLYLGEVGLFHILAYMFLLGLAFTFGPNARRAIYGDSVRKSRVVDALALDGAAFSLGHLAMPAVVAFVLAAYGTTTAFAMQCVLYATMTALAFIVKLPHRQREEASRRSSFLKSVADGIDYARSQAGIRRVLIISSLLALFGDQYLLALVPIVSRDVFDSGATGVGVLVTGGAIGGLIGPAMLIAMKRPLGALGALVGSIGIKALGMVLFAFSPSLALGMGAFMILYAMSPVQKALLDGYIQLAVPSEYRGRVGSLNQMTRGLAALAAFLAGVMVQFLGVWLAIVAAGVLIAVIGVWSLVGLRYNRIEGW